MNCTRTLVKRAYTTYTSSGYPLKYTIYDKHFKDMIVSRNMICLTRIQLDSAQEREEMITFLSDKFGCKGVVNMSTVLGGCASIGLCIGELATVASGATSHTILVTCASLPWLLAARNVSSWMISNSDQENILKIIASVPIN